jgi:hypothetical protein
MFRQTAPNLGTGVPGNTAACCDTQDIPGSNIDPAKLTTMLVVKFGPDAYDLYVSEAQLSLTPTNCGVLSTHNKAGNGL